MRICNCRDSVRIDCLMCTRDTSSSATVVVPTAVPAAPPGDAVAVASAEDPTVVPVDSNRLIDGGGEAVSMEGTTVDVAVAVAVTVDVEVALVVIASPQSDVVVDGHGDTAGLSPRDEEATLLPLPLFAAIIVANSLLSLRSPVPGDDDLLE